MNSTEPDLDCWEDFNSRAFLISACRREPNGITYAAKVRIPRERVSALPQVSVALHEAFMLPEFYLRFPKGELEDIITINAAYVDGAH